jgi:hypothetical protein
MKLISPLYCIWYVQLVTHSTGLPHIPSVRDHQCDFEQMLQYPSSGGTQAAATGGLSAIDHRGCTVDGKDIKCCLHVIYSKENVLQMGQDTLCCLSKHQPKYSRCFRQFRNEVLWNFWCLNCKQYEIKYTRNYFMTNLRIILPPTPRSSNLYVSSRVFHLKDRTLWRPRRRRNY